MNKISVVATSILITMGMIQTAHANNRWTGFYAGTTLGVAFNHVQLSSQQLGFTNPTDTYNTSTNFATFSPGIQVGYMYHVSKFFVPGIEGNVSFNTNQKRTLTYKSSINPAVYDSFTFRNRMQTSIRGRIGAAIDLNQSSLLPYLTAGASFVNVELVYKNEGGDYYSHHTMKAGWLVGAGLDWAFTQHGSLRGEYYYVNYGNTINVKIPSVYGLLDVNGNGRVNLSSNNIVVSINYWI